MPIATKTLAPVTLRFADDGSIPNNALPLVLYRGAIDLAGSPDPEKLIERTFAANGWGDMWRNGIYPYVHYHSMIHEAMGIARGRAKVRFGGDNGEAIDVTARRRRHPAGRHRPSRLTQTAELVVVGAYPPAGKNQPVPRQPGGARRGPRLDPQRAAAGIRPGVRTGGTLVAPVAGMSCGRPSF